MITPISPDGIVYVYATFAINTQRLRCAGPTMPLHPDDVLPDTPEFNRWLEKHTAGACQLDTYQELRQLSFMQNNGYTHIILRPNGKEEVVDWTEPGTVPGTARLWFVNNAGLALTRFWHAMNQIVNYPTACIVAGWQIRNELWPRLITNALRHGIPVDQAFRNDPMSKFSTVKLLLDVSEIYLQGAYPGVRKVPELPDALEYFGIQQVCPVNPLVDANTLANYTVKDWVERGHMQVTNFLYGMQSLVRQYYA